MRLSAAEWAARQVQLFPVDWQTRILSRWSVEQEGRGERAANNNLRHRVGQLTDAARCGIRPDSRDDDIVQRASVHARDFAERLGKLRRHIEKQGRDPALYVRAGMLYVRHLMGQRAMLDLLPVPSRTISRAGILLRVQCERFWRRVLRRVHARTVEACAIDLGLVSRAAGLYASNEAVKRRRGQLARIAAALESVHAVNESGQDYTLAELAAKGTANKAIRRAELMTRLAGFELISKDCGHAATMVTVTCPSRMHRCTTHGGRTVDNEKWDGTTPEQAQRYLSGQWAKARAAAARKGMQWYGFRVAEPQHDGTPHWHIILFHEAGQRDRLQDIFWRYFLMNEAPNEPGARKHRVGFEAINPARGSAVAYVSKYISKNIDGYNVGNDLEGKPAVETSARVEAWASTWRIRQFQQIGGAPVGLWRELRRMHPEQITDKAPEAMRHAMQAVVIAAEQQERGGQAYAWMRYTQAAGGLFCKREKRPLKLLRQQSGECGRYGEVMPGAVAGIVGERIEYFRNHIHQMNPAAPAFQRRLSVGAESERQNWIICNRADVERVRARGSAAAWTRVNNCTRPALDHSGDVLTIMEKSTNHRGEVMPLKVAGAMSARSILLRKIGRVKSWGKGRGEPENQHHARTESEIGEGARGSAVYG